MSEETYRIKIRVEQMIQGEEIYPFKLFSITRSTISKNFSLSFWKCVSEIEDCMISELNIPIEIELEENLKKEYNNSKQLETESENKEIESLEKKNKKENNL